MDANDLQAAIVQYLAEQGLGDISEYLAKVLLEYCLDWKVPSGNTTKVDGIVAFAFGNQVDSIGNKSPGPINEQLADQLVKHYSLLARKCKVWAQWEIAEFVGNRIPKTDLIAIYPIYERATSKVTYLSTRGVLGQVEEHLPKGKTIFVIAHRDHLWRCVHLTRQFGYRVVADQDEMPSDYDPHSGQLWTSSRDRYVLSDIISRLGGLRHERNELWRTHQLGEKPEKGLLHRFWDAMTTKVFGAPQSR